LRKELHYLKMWEIPVIKPSAKVALIVTNNFERMLELYTTSGLQDSALLQSYLFANFIELNKYYRSSLVTGTPKAVELAEQFRRLLHQHIKEKQLVTDYARLLKVTPNHLNKTMKSVSNKSTTQWINETLITEARILIAQTNKSLLQISDDLGFLDHSYFSRLFKKYEKISPSAYRKMIEKSW